MGGLSIDVFELPTLNRSEAFSLLYYLLLNMYKKTILLESEPNYYPRMQIVQFWLRCVAQTLLLKLLIKTMYLVSILVPSYSVV